MNIICPPNVFYQGFVGNKDILKIHVTNRSITYAYSNAKIGRVE